MDNIHFLEGKELKYSRAYYELSVPNIVEKSLFIIIGIVLLIIFYVIIAPYDVFVK